MELVIEYEEQEEEEVEEGLIEGEEEEMVEAEEEEQEEEGDEIVVEIEEQREEVEEAGQDSQSSALVANEEEEESTSGVVELPPVVVEEEVAVADQQPPAEEIESEAFALAASSEPGPSSSVPQANIRPPPREDRLPSFGRNTLAFEDGGDDGIVPSTPVLLRPRTNDGFAEAVSSPQVNTRFVFGTVPELTLPTGSSGHLESQGMEDTRMDLSQLEENSGRSVPSTPLQVSPHDELPAAGEEASVVPSSEEQGDFEGGPDLEGDAAAEIDLLGEDDQDTAEGAQPEQEAMPTTTTAEDDPLPEAPVSATEGTSQQSVLSTPPSPSVRPQMR